MSVNEIPEHIDTKLKLLAKNIEINWHQLREATLNITLKHTESHEGPWPISEQYLKVHEEAVESYKAYMRNYENDDEEHMDLLFTILTLAHRRKRSRELDQAAIYECLKKFHLRGWLF